MERDNADITEDKTDKEEPVMPLPAKRERYTFSDVLTWDENERIEIINGEAFMIAPPSSYHQEISGEL